MLRWNTILESCIKLACHEIVRQVMHKRWCCNMSRNYLWWYMSQFYRLPMICDVARSPKRVLNQGVTLKFCISVSGSSTWSSSTLICTCLSAVSRSFCSRFPRCCWSLCSRFPRGWWAISFAVQELESNMMREGMTDDKVKMVQYYSP